MKITLLSITTDDDYIVIKIKKNITITYMKKQLVKYREMKEEK